MNEHSNFIEDCIWQHWYICLLVCKHASETAKLISTCCWLTLGDSICVLLLFDFSSYLFIFFISASNLYLIRAQFIIHYGQY